VLRPATASGTVRETIRCEIIRITESPNLWSRIEQELTFGKGYHVPAVRHRDAFYTKIEEERAKALGQ